MSEENKEHSTTMPVILIGVEPTQVPEVRKVTLLSEGAEGLIHSEFHWHGDRIELQLINKELRVIVKKGSD